VRLEGARTAWVDPLSSKVLDAPIPAPSRSDLPTGRQNASLRRVDHRLVFRSSSNSARSVDLLWFLGTGSTCRPDPPTATLSGGARLCDRLSVLDEPAYVALRLRQVRRQRNDTKVANARQGVDASPREDWLACVPAPKVMSTWSIGGNPEDDRRQYDGFEQTGAANVAPRFSPSHPFRHCGRKMTVRYTGSAHDVLRYPAIGDGGCGEPRCIAFGGLRVDDAMTWSDFEVLEPGAIEAASRRSGTKRSGVMKSSMPSTAICKQRVTR